MPRTPKGYEPEARVLGRLLRDARGRRDQREVAAAAELSDSSLSRFERGEYVPSLDDARRLDEVLGLDEDVAQRVRAILYPVGGGPAVAGRRLFVAVFPPDHLGPVHVRVVTATGQAAAAVDLELIWGEWRYRQSLEVDMTGWALLFAKVEKGDRSVPLRITTSVPVAVAYGCGLPDGLPDQRIIDANDGWTARSQDIPNADDNR